MGVSLKQALCDWSVCVGRFHPEKSLGIKMCGENWVSGCYLPGTCLFRLDGWMFIFPENSALWGLPREFYFLNSISKTVFIGRRKIFVYTYKVNLRRVPRNKFKKLYGKKYIIWCFRIMRKHFKTLSPNLTQRNHKPKVMNTIFF